MIPNPLQDAGNKDKVHVAWHKLSVQRSLVDELLVDGIG
jgi:hypothetical protein